MSVARWRLISRAPWIARSSHCACITSNGHLVVYGGELQPRVPVDSAASPQDGLVKGSLHVFDLKSPSLDAANGGWHTLQPISKIQGTESTAPSVPDARVGATMVEHDGDLYVWGGRGGVEMFPLGQEQAGVWRAKLKSGDAAGEQEIGVEWDRIGADDSIEAPEPRSYHASLIIKEKLYVHAGCPTTGRLSGLHSFDLSSRKWQRLATAHDPPRGGTVLATTLLKQWHGVAVLRYGGFSGYELPSVPGAIDVYPVSEDRWYTVVPAPDPIHGYPGARSVHGFVPFRSTSPALQDVAAVLFHGERDASQSGHEGAGKFWNDVWMVMRIGSYGHTERWAWKKADIVGDQTAYRAEDKANTPEGRGWFAFAVWVDNGNTRILMHGGLLSSNERSDELWELQIE